MKNLYWGLSLLLAIVAFGAAWGALRSGPSERQAGAISRPEPRVPGAKSHPRGQIEGQPRGVDEPSSSEDDIDGPRRPHPITPLHETMAERRELLGAVQSALAGGEYEKARALLGEASGMQRADADESTLAAAVRGYRLILDCLEARAAVGAARELPHDLLEDSRKYLDEQRLPPRRDVRRVCLEGRPFGRRG